MSDKVVMWIMIKNIVVVIATCVSVYYISGWMAFLLLLYTMVEIKKEDGNGSCKK